MAKMMDEVKSIFSFAPKFTVLITTQDKIPEKIDFTDSIVKVVATDDDVSTMQNQAEQQELRSIEFAIKKNKLNIKMASFKRNSARPERGGVGWQAKEVLAVGGQKVALVQTGGIASAETAATDVLTFLAPNHWTLKEAEEKRDGKLNKAKLAHGKDQEDKITEANTSFQRSIGRCKAPLPKAGLRTFRTPWASRWGASLRMRRDISTLWTTSTMVDWVASPLNFWELRVRKNFLRMIRRTLSASLPNLTPSRKRQQFTSKHSQRAKPLLSKNKVSRLRVPLDWDTASVRSHPSGIRYQARQACRCFLERRVEKRFVRIFHNQNNGTK